MTRRCAAAISEMRRTENVGIPPSQATASKRPPLKNPALPASLNIIQHQHIAYSLAELFF